MKKFLTSLVLALVLVLACCAVASAADTHGYEIKSKSVVSWEQVEKGSITTIDGHAVNPTAFVTVKPTCTERGYAEYDCLDASATKTPHYHTVYVEALGHDWSSLSGDENWGKVIEVATCTSKGLAQDICLRCKETREVYREIDKTPHEYNDKTYNVYKAPTCTATGLGQHKCIYCGAVKAEKEADMVVLPMIPHTWSDWTILDKPVATCDTYGAARRVCLVCNAEQKLDAAHDVDGLRDKVVGVAKLNNKWVNQADQSFQTQAAYDAYLNSLKFEYTVKKNWLVDCYTRTIIYTCPYCEGKVHKDFTVTLKKPLTVAHVFNTTADKNLSVAATCTLDGFNVYLCSKDDADHDDSSTNPVDLKYDPYFVEKYTVNKTDYQIKKVAKIEFVPALGHKWTEWELIRTYTKDGVNYGEYLRDCSVCHEVQEELREIEEIPAYTGLVNEDGEWKYYVEDVFQSDYNGIVSFQGGKFFVAGGIVCSDASGLNLYNGTWYFLSNGQIQSQYSGLAQYNGEWFYITDGVLNTTNGLISYDGGRFLVSEGRIRRDVSGLWQNGDGKWYYLAAGQVADYTGVAYYDGRFFVVNNGILNDGYNGTIEYDGATFEVANGQLGVFPITAEEAVEETTEEVAE